MKNHSVKILSIVCSICAVFLCAIPAHALNVLSFESSPQSWVGQGQSFTVTPDDGYTFEHFGMDWAKNDLRIDISNFKSLPDYYHEDAHAWTLALAAPHNQPLKIGHYADAARYSFQEESQPGLTFSGDHRTNGSNAGFFDILEIEFDAEGVLQKLAVNFTQYGELNPDWWIHGKLRFNSNISLDDTPIIDNPAVPEPSTLLLLGSGLLGVVALRRKYRRQ